MLTILETGACAGVPGTVQEVSIREQSMGRTEAGAGTGVPGTSNGNDIEAKQNDTSIIWVFSISKRNETSYSKTQAKQSKAKTIIIVLFRIEEITNVITPEFSGSKTKQT
jgi:hypothetical protein